METDEPPVANGASWAGNCNIATPAASPAMNGRGNGNGNGSASPPAARYLALDTNVLLNHFPLVRSLYARMLVGDSWLLIPTTVVNELDGLKASTNRASRTSDLTVGDVARSVTAWLLDVVRAQRRGAAGRVRLERWSDAEQSVAGGTSADDSILACCLYFASSAAHAAHAAQAAVTLWTDDRNLALLAEANGVPTLGGRVSLSKLCAAAGVEGEAMEAMEVDGNGLETDDADLPLFSRRRRKNAPNDFFGPSSSSSSSHSYAHANGTASVPDFSHSHSHFSLPPPGALAAALAELAHENGMGTESPSARPHTRPKASSFSSHSAGHNRSAPAASGRPTNTHTQKQTFAALPPSGSLAAALAEMRRQPNASSQGTSSAAFTAPSSSPSAPASKVPKAPLAPPTASPSSASSSAPAAMPPPGALAAAVAELAAMPKPQGPSASSTRPSTTYSTSATSHIKRAKPSTPTRSSTAIARGGLAATDSVTSGTARFSPYASAKRAAASTPPAASPSTATFASTLTHQARPPATLSTSTTFSTSTPTPARAPAPTPTPTSTSAVPPYQNPPPDPYALIRLPSGRNIPASLAHSLSTILTTACTTIAPDDTLPSDPGRLASTLADQLADLLARESGGSSNGNGNGNGGLNGTGELTNGNGTMSEYTRPLAICTGAARTLRAWLNISPGAGRRVRDGEAADAVLLLCAELSGLGMPLDRVQWESVARGVREC